jgi:ribosome biogenesis GTPase A
MSIQWFPGHMTSARKHATDAMKSVDVVVEVLDARLPEASSNPMIHALRTHRNRPCLKLLNKADLADPDATAAWLKHFNSLPNTKAVALSARKPGDATRIPQLAQSLAPHRDDNLKPLRLIIMGIPNVGKSTLMNALVKRRVAATGDEPAITKSIQRIHLTPRLTLYDTPGLMWQGRRRRSRESRIHAAAGLPRRRHRPHQPGNARQPRPHAGAGPRRKGNGRTGHRA